jgi:dipeptidyl aminopeptidase/acylaminoacyl peptidase
MAGIYDLPLMFEKGDIQTVDRGVNYLKAAVGEDMEELRRRSPVYNAEAIKAPVLLLHGKADQRAPILHGVRMRDALTKAGKSVTWISESGEAHGFQNQDHVVDAYERMLAFLDAHIGH